MKRTINVAMTLVGVTLLVLPLAVLLAAPRADAAPFIGFNVLAESNGLGMKGGSPTAQSYPQVQGIVPQALVRLNTGPTGYALSSAAWPGALLGNAGTLAHFLATQSGGQTPPDEVKSADYPVRAEAFSSGPNDDTFDPGMKAHAQGGAAEATADMQDFATDPGIVVEQMRTHSAATLRDVDTIAETSARVSGISLAGGQVLIDSVVTTATAISDGEHPTASGTTIVKGVTIAGQNASIDASGVHFADTTNPNPADAVAQQVGEQVLSNLGMKLWVTQPAVTQEPGAISYASGSLVVYWDLGNSGQGIGVLTIGGSVASAHANPATPLATVPTVPVTPPTLPVATAPDPLAPSVGGLGTTAPTGGAPAVETGDGTAAPATFNARPVALFTGISPGLLIASLAGAGLAAAGLRRVQDGVLGASAEACPLEEDG